MTFKEFPRVEVSTTVNSMNPWYVNSLMLPLQEPYDSLAHAVAMPVESDGRFLGATMDSYHDYMRYRANGVDLPDEDFSELFMKHLVENPQWFYGVVMDGKDPSGVEAILKGREVRPVLEERSGEVIFVPDEGYTRDTWGFKYDPERDLRVVRDFSPPADQTRDVLDIAEGIGAVVALMRKGENISLVYLRDLFRRASEPRYKEVFSEMLQERLGELANNHRDIFRGHMQRCGFTTEE